MYKASSEIAGIAAIILLIYISKLVNVDTFMGIVLFGILCVKFGELD